MKRFMTRIAHMAAALLLAMPVLASLQPNPVSAGSEPVVTASYPASGNAVIDQQAAYQNTHYSQKHQGAGSVLAYNVKAGNGTERQAYFKFDLPDPNAVSEATVIYLSMKGKSNSGKGELDFTVHGVVYGTDGGWSSDFAAHNTIPDSESTLLTWNNAPARYNSQKVSGSEIGFETSSADVYVETLGTFTTNETDNEYRIDVTSFVKTYGQSAVSFLVRGSKTDPSTIYNSFNSDHIANGTYGSTDKKPALILMEGEPAFTVEPYSLTASSVAASGDDGNVPANTIDNNTYTRWSAQNMTGAPRQWIQYDLGSVKPIGYLGIAFYSGASRVSVFDIAVSDDGENWTAVLEQSESAETNDVQAIDLHSHAISARYVRYIGHGNLSSNAAQVDWNSLTEFQIYKPHPEQLPLVIQAPYIEPETPDAVPFTVPGLHLPDGTPYAPHTPNVTTGTRWNVVDFGADVADNDNDDTAAIIAAIQTAKSGDEVYLPNGIYNLITTLDATTNFELKSGVNFIGESQDGVILLSYLNEKGNTRVIKAFNKNNIRIANMTITSIFERSGKQYSTVTTSENPDIGGFGNGIYIDQSGGKGSHHITIEHVTIEHFQRMGIRINKSHNITVRNSLFRKATDVGAGGAGYGIAIQGEPKRDPLGEDIDTYFVLVEHNRFEGPYLRHGVIVQYYAHNNLVQHNEFDGTLLDAIDLHGEDEYLNEIAYNLVQHVPFGGIGVGNTGGTPPNSNHDASGPFNYIHHNTVKNTRDGILVYMGSPDTIIEANTISDTHDYAGAAGIKVMHAPRTIVKNNIITNNTATDFWGIRLTHDPGDLNLGGAYAGDPTDVQITGNMITGNRNGLKIEAGSGHIVRNNTIAENTGKNWSILIPLTSMDTDLDAAEHEEGSAGNNGGSTGGGGSETPDSESSGAAGEATAPPSTTVAGGNSIVVRAEQWGEAQGGITLATEQLQEAFAAAAEMDNPRIVVELPLQNRELSVSFPAEVLDAAAQSNPAIRYTIATGADSFTISNALLLSAYQAHPDSPPSIRLTIRQASDEVAIRIIEAARAAGLEPAAAALLTDIAIVTADGEALSLAGAGAVDRTMIVPEAVPISHAAVLRYNPQDDSFSYVPALFNSQDGQQIAAFQAEYGSLYLIAAGTSSFADLDNHYAKLSIEQLAAKQIIKGLTPTVFAPELPMTRAQLATLLIRAMGLDQLDVLDGSEVFNDVNNKDWHYRYVQQAVAHGLLQGTSEGSFAPNQPLTREQLAATVRNALMAANYTPVSVDQLNELMAGQPGADSAPQEPVTRAEAAVVLTKLLQLLKYMN